MKNYIRLLPLIIFPYAYLILILSVCFIPGLKDAVQEEITGVIIIIITAIYLLLTLFCTIAGSVRAAISDISPRTAAKLNLVVKAVQIPAYVFHFLLGLAGTVMSVWGIGFIIFAVAIDLASITLTGIHAIGCVVKMLKGGVTGKGTALLAAICSFIFCIDLITAVRLFKLCGNAKNVPAQTQTGEENAV